MFVTHSVSTKVDSAAHIGLFSTRRVVLDKCLLICLGPRFRGHAFGGNPCRGRHRRYPWFPRYPVARSSRRRLSRDARPADDDPVYHRHLAGHVQPVTCLHGLRKRHATSGNANDPPRPVALDVGSGVCFDVRHRSSFLVRKEQFVGVKLVK